MHECHLKSMLFWLVHCVHILADGEFQLTRHVQVGVCVLAHVERQTNDFHLQSVGSRLKHRWCVCGSVHDARCKV
jgi:hypothetical protein